MKKLILFFSLLFVVLSCFAEGVLTESQRRKIRYGIVANSPTAMDFEYGMTLEEAMQKGRYPFCITDDVEEAKDFFEWLPEYLYFTERQTKRFFRDITEDFDYIAAAKEVSEISRDILFEKYERGLIFREYNLRRGNETLAFELWQKQLDRDIQKIKNTFILEKE